MKTSEKYLNERYEDIDDYMKPEIKTGKNIAAAKKDLMKILKHQHVKDLSKDEISIGSVKVKILGYK